MTEKIIECIPNFSEARRPEIITAILHAIAAVTGVAILDCHSDFDHNRTVITFAGEPQAVEKAAFQAISKAAELINLDEHTGEHPRIGATDVVPFVPISGVTMQECVEMAHRVGQRVGDQLSIPVYLYEEAASRPERQNLENIRRGQYETLKETIHSDSERFPDYGPAQIGPAGATVIGARQPLIAFNVYLTTDDLQIAQRIARTIRHSSGGLRFVKALGMQVDGRAQVSMNLTNYRKTPLALVVELIRREAQRYGVGIHHSELVGLIPQDALIDAAVWFTQLDQFSPEQVLESRLMAARTETDTKAEQSSEVQFLDALASGDPTPGGGAASAYTGAMAAALTAMVARVTVGKKKYSDVESQMQQIIPEADELRKNLLLAASQDAKAFEAVMEAYRLPKDTPEKIKIRQVAIQQTMEDAARIPLSVMNYLVDVLMLAGKAAKMGNLNAITDAASATELAFAASRSASFNVRVNLTSLTDQMVANALWEELEKLEERSAILAERTRTFIRDRGGPALA